MERPRFSPEVRAYLAAAGWTEDRDRAADLERWDAALRPEFTLFPAARDALRRFGGLRVICQGPGEEKARENFDLDPTLALGESDRFEDAARALTTRLYPLGEAVNGRTFLAIAEDGRVFMVMEEVFLAGTSIEHAIEAMVRGLELERI